MYPLAGPGLNRYRSILSLSNCWFLFGSRILYGDLNDNPAEWEKRHAVMEVGDESNP